MKALTVQQPWAEAVMSGRKPIETRTWSTTHRGPLLIHASKTPRIHAADPLAHRLGACGKLDYGAIIGSVDVVDCRPLLRSDEAAAACPWSPGRYAWVLANPTRFHEPVPARGMLGLWKAPATAYRLASSNPGPNGLPRRVLAWWEPSGNPRPQWEGILHMQQKSLADIHRLPVGTYEETLQCFPEYEIVKGRPPLE